MKLRTRILSGLLSLVMVVASVPFGSSAVQAAEAAVPQDGLIADYSFVEAPENGTTVKNQATGAEAVGDATVYNAGGWSDNALVFNGTGTSNSANGTWVSLPNNILAGEASATISIEVKADATMLNNYHFLWNIGNSGTSTYWFMCMKDPRTSIKYSNSEKNAYGYSLEADRWYSLTAVIDADAKMMYLYIDGEKVGEVQESNMSLARVTDQSRNTIGRAPYNDPMFKGAVSTFRVYDRALDAKEVKAISEVDGKLHEAQFSTLVKEAIKDVKDITVSTSTTTLPDYNGTVTWESKMDEIVIGEDGLSATVDQPEVGGEAITGTLTATMVLRGAVATKDVTVTVKPEVGPDDPFGYLMVHFVEDSAGYAEKIYLDITRGDNPQQWDPLNGRKPILTSKNGTTGVRDPFITYSPETETYYIIATDLRVFGGDDAGWGAWQSNYSTKMNVWESKDLITWSEGRQYDVALNVDGEKEDIYMGMMWAPETTWVDDYYGEGDGAFVVYWSSMTSDGYSKIMYGVTKDFTQETYEFGGVFIDPGHTVIDTTILQAGDKTYHITKDNQNGKELYMQVTEDERWWEPGTQWTTIQTNIGQARFGACEGPATFIDHSNENSFYLFVDDYPTPGYQPMYTSNPDDGWEYLDTSDYFLTSNTKHGGIISLTKAQYDALRNADAVSAVKEDLGSVMIDVGETEAALMSLLPEKAEVNLAYNMGTGELPVVWDTSSVNFNAQGVYEVTGIVQSIGANKNQWVGDNNSTSYLAANKVLYSSEAIEVTAKVMVSADGMTVIDKTTLQKTVDAAVPAENAAKYTAQTWRGYAKALAAAKALLAEDAQTTQEEVNAAVAALIAAQEALEEIPLEERLKLVASYDMSAADGKLTDKTGNGNEATLVGFNDKDFSVEGEEDTVLSFAAGKYAELPAGLIEGEEFAIEATFKSSTTSFAWLWYLGTIDNNNYVFVSPKFDTNGIRAGIKYNGDERLFNPTAKVADGIYTTIKVVFDEGNMTLFVNGAEISTLETGFSVQKLLEIGTSGDYCGRIGGPSLWNDPAFVGTITQFDVYSASMEEEAPQLPYEDVAETAWYYDAVYNNYFANLMTGKTETLFAPKEALTRAQFALILYRIEGEPDVTSDKKFDDVSAGSWYTDAVLWAYEEGIITGYANTNKFGPHDNIMREQMAVMMYRYAKTKNPNVAADADLSKFADVDKLGDYAEEAMKWAVGNGIITGKDETTLAPRANTIRAEAAVVIDRFMGN